jgi:hypothetical protein
MPQYAAAKDLEIKTEINQSNKFAWKVLIYFEMQRMMSDQLAASR